MVLFPFHCLLCWFRLVFLTFQCRWPWGRGVVFGFGWGGQQDPSGMTFEEGPEGCEGQALRASPEGRLSHQGPEAEAGLGLGPARSSVWLEQSEHRGPSTAGRAGPSEDCGFDPEWDGMPQAGYAQSRGISEWGRPGCRAGREGEGPEQVGNCSW